MNKSGSLPDLIFVAVILLVFSITVIIVFKVSNEINTKIQLQDGLDTKGKVAFDQVNNIYSGTLDNMFLFLAVGLSIGALILAASVRVHPIFFILFLIALFLLIFLSGIFSNIYLGMANNAEMQDVAEKLTFTTKLMGVLPFFIGIMGFLLAIVMYKNWREEN